MIGDKGILGLFDLRWIHPPKSSLFYIARPYLMSNCTSSGWVYFSSRLLGYSHNLSTGIHLTTYQFLFYESLFIKSLCYFVFSEDIIHNENRDLINFEDAGINISLERGSSNGNSNAFNIEIGDMNFSLERENFNGNIIFS